MSEHPLLAPLLESYFRRRLTKQRNKSKAFVDEDRAKLLTVLLATLWLGFSVRAVWIVMIAGGTSGVRPALHP
jgi:hypothetical protein